MKRTIEELIRFAWESLAKYGFTESYIRQLSHTWNAFREFICESGNDVTRETADHFLQSYGINPKNNYFKLTRTNKRRKRAICILLNCMEHGMAITPKGYLLSRFDKRYELEFESLIEKRRSQDLSIKTVELDIHVLNKLSEYLVSIDLPSLNFLKSYHIISFMKWLSTTGQLPTMLKATTTLRFLCKHLYNSGASQHDLSEHVPKVRTKSDRIPSTYNPDEIQCMLDSFNRSSKVGARNYAMVLLAARLGMRASDICALKFENLNWHNNTVEFNTIKTGAYTVLPLTVEVGEAIIEYLRNGRPTVNDKHVFIRFQTPYRKLQPSVLHTIVTKSMRDAGIVLLPGKRHGPHSLRASLASEMLAHNTPIHVISEALSHSCLDTTRIYLKIDIVSLRSISLDVPSIVGVWMGGAPI